MIKMRTIAAAAAMATLALDATTTPASAAPVPSGTWTDWYSC
ncbi:hypothetical protein ACIQOW_37135 [Kitasatospora sp. NPDC091335]